MKNRLLESYKLRKRLEKLESLVYERSIGKGGAPSIAMNIWTFLMDHGPSTKEEIDAGLGARYSNNPALNSWVRAGLITKRGDRYVADPNYVWDDVGVINRSVPPEIRQAIQDASSSDEPTEEPVRRTRQPRAPRVKEIKKNLFSRKYDEVKAAIDAGEDVNQRNDSGFTPIVYACRERKGTTGNIVRLLLENGADPNEGNIIFTAIKYYNIGAIKALGEHGVKLDTYNNGNYPIEYAIEHLPIFDDAVMDAVITLTDTSIGESLRTGSSAITALYKKRLSKEWYSALINKTYDTDDVVKAFFYHGDILVNELKLGVSTLYDLYERHSGAMPPMREYAVRYLNDSNTFALNRIFNTIKDVTSGKLGCGDFTEMLEIYGTVSEKLNKTIDGILDFITPEYIEEEVKSGDVSNLFGILTYAIDHNNINIINMIAKARVRILNGNDIISYIADPEISNPSRQITAAVLRVVSNCKDTKDELGNRALYRTMAGNNSYLIDWVIDNGFGQVMVDLYNSILYKNEMSDTCKNALIKAGFDLKKTTPADDVRRDNAYRRYKQFIIRLIENDEWNRDAESMLNEFPELLTDKDIIETIEDNPDSVTASQLKRRIDALPKDDLKYDF